MSVDLICTIGPASSSPAVLKELLLSGMTIARLNMSHGSHEEHGRVIEVLRAAAAESGQPVRIMGDLQGPKIRLMSVKGDAVRLDEGQTFILDQSDEPGGRERAALDNPGVMEDILQGAAILINDGEVKLEVTDKHPQRITTRVIVGGTIGSRKGVNLPGTKIRLPAITEKDKQDLQFLLEHHVDWIACSFIRVASHLEEIREFVSALGKYSQPGLISKIETIHAVRNFPSIMEASDGIMIARGDLGVELPFERIPFIQKAILRECSRSKTYVITATQMLQSMVDHPVPTRAEVTDVSQAVLDGTDAVMLSAESSVGHYPVQSTRVLNTVAKFAENMREQGESGLSLEEICSDALFNELNKKVAINNRSD
ncbi:pyruvate kinase [Paenibacillus donghaensis]|uniref:Pyruvate kinase n=1 Tax=Paenibacillus donghaensis TaxID=414771 RepID=A0A2Z2KNK6_9BACL|nr:pyruvate kinase [Paenibacillus donghaensis]ASA20348.1 pyruvate kinase [Paenibacillus donghaensis]